MEGIDHVDVVQVCCRRLVSDIDGMAQGQVPDGEGLELGVSGLDAPLVLMIELGQAGGHLAAAGTGGRDDDQVAAGLYIVIASKSLVAEDVADILRVAVNDIVQIGTDAQGTQLLAEFIGRALARILGDHDAGDEKASGLQGVLEAQDIYVIGDAQVAADLVLFNGRSVNDDHDLGLILELLQHLQLVVRRESGQDTGGVIIIEQLTSEFQVQLAELGHPLLNVLGLKAEIFVGIKSYSSR